MERKGSENMSEVSVSEVLSMIFSVLIRAVLLFIAYQIGRDDGWKEGYMDNRDFEKTVRDTFREARPIQTDHAHGGDADDV